MAGRRVEPSAPAPLLGARERLRAAILGAVVVTVVVAAFADGGLARAQEARPPAAGARSAIVVDAATGTVLYERNARAEYAPASLTKMVTALVAIERAPLDRPVRATHQYEVVPVLIGLEPG